ncbi:hypothetical protein ACFFJT_14655 [Dyella flava]|uniref:Uncharacterized protein n=1 Tax=Dyella flava TaxID=1920170 RepID=A0ABS2JYA9_9GAMM|nr:hypothetical protein [Dyella flava]MBM7123849.1 hypothetical protein [Dyella flava]GLQ52585.1 hypothetical protein GCM10010872_40340 [Dyella flava]
MADKRQLSAHREQVTMDMAVDRMGEYVASERLVEITRGPLKCRLIKRISR